MKTEIDKGAWNELNRGVVRSKYETEWETVDHWHARDGGLWSNDWLEDKKKQAFITNGTCVTPWWCHALDMFEIGLNIQQGWRHHADLPLPGVQNSHPALSKRWREHVQQQGGLLSNDWLKKNRTRLQTGRVWRPNGVTPLKCLFAIIFY